MPYPNTKGWHLLRILCYRLEYYLINSCLRRLFFAFSHCSWISQCKIVGRNINNLRCEGDTTLMAESKEELKGLLIKVKDESEKAGLKLSIQKTKITASGLITSNRWGNNGNSDRFYLIQLQNHCRWWPQPWN